MKIDGCAVALHEDDHWIDEIRLLDSHRRPLMRLFTIYRYKMSGLSGDEWRISSLWQATRFAMLYGCEPSEELPGWFNVQGGWPGNLSTGCAALYPLLVGDQPQSHSLLVGSICFLRKGRLLYEQKEVGGTPLINVAGRLPWELITANDQPLGTSEAWEDMRTKCFQPGCAHDAVSTYQLVNRYDRRGNEAPAQNEIRRFCPIHLRRGDCGLDDSDRNYTVISGPGPEGRLSREALEATLPSRP